MKKCERYYIVVVFLSVSLRLSHLRSQFICMLFPNWNSECLNGPVNNNFTLLLSDSNVQNFMILHDFITISCYLITVQSLLCEWRCDSYVIELTTITSHDNVSHVIHVRYTIYYKSMISINAFIKNAYKYMYISKHNSFQIFDLLIWSQM